MTGKGVFILRITATTMEKENALVKPAGVKEQLLYEGTLHFKEVIDYGVNFQDIVSNAVSVPPAGARFDVLYEGTIQGTRLSGKLTGVDYLTVRADRCVQMHIHGQIQTADGARVAYAAEAVGASNEETGITLVRENVRLHSAFANYTWVNNLAVWAEIIITPANGEIKVKAYQL